VGPPSGGGDLRDRRKERLDERLSRQLGDIDKAAEQANVLALLTALESESPQVRLAAIQALGDVGGDKASLALSRLAKDRYGEKPELRIAALEALGKTYEPGRYADYLEGFVSDENRKVIAGARRLLEKADPEGFPGRLVRLGCLDHAAIRVYGRARIVEAVPLLAGFLEERVADGSVSHGSYWGKVYAATKSLGSIGGAEARQALEDLVESARAHEKGGFLEVERMEKVERGALEALERTRWD
jgi:HEAT repeat protein